MPAAAVACCSTSARLRRPDPCVLPAQRVTEVAAAWHEQGSCMLDTLKRLAGVSLLAFCAVLAAAPAQAQETINYASVSGRVTDPSGAVVGGALVSARNLDTNVMVA